MGGKVWSTEEERIFWEVVIPRSPAAANPVDQALTWKQCVDLMIENIGDSARREYTSTMLYEHHYQNFKPGAKSPKANRFLEKYLRHVEWYKDNTSPPPPSPPRAPVPEDPLLTALLNNHAKSKSRRPRKSPQARGRSTLNQSAGPSASTSESENEASGHSTPTGSGSSSFTPANTTRQQPSGGYRASVPLDAETKFQPSYHQVPKVGPRLASRAFLNRSGEPLEGGYWRMVPRAQQSERPRQVMNMAPRNINPQPRQPPTQRFEYSSAPKPPQLTSGESEKEWNGKLPSIREMYPQFDLEQESFTSAYYAMSQPNKRSYYNNHAYEPIPKRRRLPDHPVPRQQDEQQPRQLY
ncbi:hypothetical protein F66182_1383 [Fusarium sp. NRRL 66182]|nr:hypothetical protein F66182_1383 [Fusarium sp. NRRL 66182]